MPLYGFLWDLSWLLSAVLLIGGFLALGYTAARLSWWTGVAAVALYGLGAPIWLWIVFGAGALVFNVPAIRRMLVTWPILKTLRALRLLPAISATERTAIESGDVWIDGELFSGKPDFQRLLNPGPVELSESEQAFLDGPVEEVCKVVDDWDVQCEKDLPEEAWALLRRHRFLWALHPEGVRRSRVLGRGSQRGRRPAVDTFDPAFDHGDGPQLARSRRAAPA